MTTNYLGGCIKIEEDFPDIKEDCCGSCHSEEDDGYSGGLSEVLVDGGYYSTCCAVAVKAREYFNKVKQ